MKRYTKSLTAMTLLLFLAACGAPEAKEGEAANGEAVADTSIYFGVRIIPGDGSPAMEDMSIVTSKGKITQVGPRKDVPPPKGSNRVDLTGRTVVPAFVNLQA